jgi:hypothetical protein
MYMDTDTDRNKDTDMHTDKDANTDSLVPDEWYYRISSTYQIVCGSKRDKRYDSTGLLSDK